MTGEWAKKPLEEEVSQGLENGDVVDSSRKTASIWKPMRLMILLIQMIFLIQMIQLNQLSELRRLNELRKLRKLPSDLSALS